MSQPHAPTPISNPDPIAAVGVASVLATLIVPPVIIVVMGWMDFRGPGRSHHEH